MENYIFRVHLKICYSYELIFDFNTPEEACNYAMQIIEHMVDSEDAKKKTSILVEVADRKTLEKGEDK